MPTRPPCPSGCHCPHCDATLAAVMRMSVSDYSDWLSQSTAAHRAAIRHSAGAKPDPVHDPMYAYRKTIPSAPAIVAPPARPVQADERSRIAYLRTAPPNGYQIAIEKMRKANG